MSGDPPEQAHAEVDEIWAKIAPGAAAARAADEVGASSGSRLQAMVVVSIVQLAAEIQKRMDTFVRPFDLSMARMGVLLQLFFIGALQPSQLSARLLVTRGNMTGLIDDLVNDGLVARRQRTGDRRAHELELTPAGRALVVEYLPHHWRALRALTAGLSDDEALQLGQLIHKLRGGMREFDPPVR